MGNKTCNSCHMHKPTTEFYVSYTTNLSIVYKSKCKECHKNHSIEYAKNNPHITRSIKKKYNLNNKEKIQEYYQNNKEKIQEYNKKYYSNPDNAIKQRNQTKQNNKRRLKEDVHYKLIENLRHTLYAKLKNSKSFSSQIYLGCDVKIYKSHLESLFYPEMTWENHGEIWEIDHIIPCALFDLTKEEEQIKCFHYTNLQPLFKTTNIAKSLGYHDIVGNRNKPKK
jgi:hypothetical protein